VTESTDAAPRPDFEHVRLWALVLDAEDIPNSVQPSPDGGWTLVVAPRDAARAAEALAAYQAENPPRAVAEPQGPASGRTWSAVAWSALLLAFFAVTMTGAGPEPWFAAGAASSGRMAAGEWWRAVTALTLHVDLGHVLSNALALAMFGTAVCLQFGAGLGLWLILGAGALGNVFNALTHPATHTGVGASTAVFGAVGVLAGSQFAHRRWRGRPGSVWAPVLSGVLLFALMGTAEYTDVLAHLWGLTMGLLLGVLAGRRVGGPPPSRVQVALTLAGALLVLGSWWLALR
jgi:rhomboid protease GluP